MKKFIIRTVVYSILFLGLCYILQFAVDNGLRKSNANDFQNWRSIIDGEINAELLITGSSRAMRMIDPKIVEESTGKSCYNLGMEGARLRSQLTRWESYFKYNDNPQMIVQTVDLMSMGHANTVFKKQQFLPFLKEDEIYDNLIEVDPKLYLDRYFPMYKYHGYIDEFKEGLMLFARGTSASKYTEYKGYESNDKAFNNEFKQMTDTLTRNYLIHPPALVKEGYEILDRLIKDCQDREIELVLVFTPQYKGFTDLQIQTDSLVMGFEKLGERDNVHFMNYVYDDICADKTYFYNAMHLNRKGANLFTEKLVADLQTNGLLE